jgi:hypothetical protein
MRKMSLKTEYGYNEDDFVQNRDGMQELTVTISLCEYRNLVKDLAYQDVAIGNLEKEIENLKKENKAYHDYIVINHPELIEKMGEFANIFLNIKPNNQPDKDGVTSE